MEKWIYLAVGSVAGGFARYLLSGAVHSKWGSGFPYGTLAVNLCGCFLIGLLNGLAEEKFLLNPHARLLLMTGFCGAFTTFSTIMLESS
ncbi:MAG TPA: CrcB family protein, partial [Elusimicrobiota bacterium]|nr:CrcB family protein [Elusimicrobiota bacterium]